MIAARAVRRALADAGRRATDVDRSRSSWRRNPSRMMSSQRSRVVRSAVTGRPCVLAGSPSEATREGLAATAAADLSADLSSGGIGIAVGLDDGGNVVALCLGRDDYGAGLRPPGAGRGSSRTSRTRPSGDGSPCRPSAAARRPSPGPTRWGRRQPPGCCAARSSGPVGNRHRIGKSIVAFGSLGVRCTRSV